MKSGQKIVNYGLYGEADGPLVADFVHCEPLETRSQCYNWAIEPHLHTQLCQLFLIESGAVTLNRNGLAVALPVPCLLLIPENTLHGFLYPSPATGRVLTLSASFLNALFARSPSVLQTLADLRIVAADAQPTAFGAISRLLTDIHAELFADLPDRHRALQAQLTLLFINLCRLSGQLSETHRPENRSLRYYTDFQQLIRQSYLLKWPLEPLCSSTQHHARSPEPNLSDCSGPNGLGGGAGLRDWPGEAISDAHLVLGVGDCVSA